MTESVDPVGAIRPQRRSGRDRRTATDISGEPVNLPAAIEGEEPVAPPPPPAAMPDSPAAFAAQLLGQPGQKRGLRAGPPVIDAARTAYKTAEYSGPADRRPPAGQVARKEI